MSLSTLYQGVAGLATVALGTSVMADVPGSSDGGAAFDIGSSIIVVCAVLAVISFFLNFYKQHIAPSPPLSTQLSDQLEKVRSEIHGAVEKLEHRLDVIESEMDERFSAANNGRKEIHRLLRTESDERSRLSNQVSELRGRITNFKQA